MLRRISLWVAALQLVSVLACTDSSQEDRELSALNPDENDAGNSESATESDETAAPNTETSTTTADNPTAAEPEPDIVEPEVTAPTDPSATASDLSDSVSGGGGSTPDNNGGDGGNTTSTPTDGESGAGGEAGGGREGSGGEGSGGSANTSGGSGNGGTGGGDGTGGAGPNPEDLPVFSFFVTSLVALQDLSGNPDGFGGDLRYGETDGLSGADKICADIAERSMPGSSVKQWRAFLSATTGGNDGGPVHAIDRIGEGPWYDRLGRTVAMTRADLLHQRPVGADPEIINDLPNEDGVPNHAPDGELVDNHDMLTGTNSMGQLYTGLDDPLDSTCNDWTSKEPMGNPRVGHPWPTGGGSGFTLAEQQQGAGPDGNLAHWISALDEAGCAPGVFLEEMGPPMAGNPTVGSGGGYGGFYCFALTP